VASDRRQIFAFSGVLKPRPGGPGSAGLIEHALGLVPDARPARRLCYVPTATGDRPEAIESRAAAFAARPDVEFSALRLFTQPSVPDIRAHLLSQDVILVEGGSVVNLMAVWRAHGLPAILRECWEAGVVLAGPSAGSLCWHLGGPTDSFRDALDPFTDGLGFLPYSNGVHDDLDDQPRRRAYRALVAGGQLPAGYATEDGVGLHYVGTGLREAVTVVPGKRAWRVAPDGSGSFYVLAADDGSVLGRFNLNFAGDGTAELGYRVAQHAAGRGLATAAVRELCQLAAARHGLRTLRAAAGRENAASRRVLAKAGFTPAGPADPAHIGGKQGTWYQRDLAADAQR